MAILASAVAALSTFYQAGDDPDDPAAVELQTVRLLAKLPTIAAFAYKKSIGQPFIYPDNGLDYEANFLRMMFAVPSEPYVVDAKACGGAADAAHPPRRPAGRSRSSSLLVVGVEDEQRPQRLARLRVDDVQSDGTANIMRRKFAS